jgi:site-specific recombinase XerD
MSVRTPKYRHHKPSGQAVVTIGGKDLYLGKWNTLESRELYHRRIAEWLTNGRCVPVREPSAAETTVSDLILAYFRHAQSYYRHADGTPTSEVRNIRLALRPLRRLYGSSAAKEFDSLALEAVREEMIRVGHCRNRINKDVARIRRLFRWAAAKKLAPAGVFHELSVVEGLRAGRSAARETPPVRPVPDTVVETTLPFLQPQVAAMVQLQRLTGMRPGEVLVIRGIDLEMDGPVWRYRPGSDRGLHGAHKNAYRGHDRVIAIGPRGQEVLRAWLRADTSEFLFQPREAEAWRDAERRKSRKTPMTPSQARRRAKQNPKRIPGYRYSVCTYATSVAKACERAFPPPAPLAKEQGETTKEWRMRLSEEQRINLKGWKTLHRWHPNQLRHAKATELRKEAGLDAARVVLGHRSPQITEVYAEIDMNKAVEIMAHFG